MTVPPPIQIEAEGENEDEVVIRANVPASLCFRANGMLCFVLSDKAPEDDLARLRALAIATYRVAQFEFAHGVYQCVMVSAHGSKLRFAMTPDDVRCGLLVVQDALQTHFVEVAC